MNLPNFLHVGAAKTGTTSQYFYFRQHPDIYMSPKKGPEFFVSRFKAGFGTGPGDGGKPVVSDFRAYQALFADAGDAQVIGEGSVSYLYHHDEAIPLIQQYLGDPRILITLRNPADLAYSYYLHLRRQGRETLSFEAALEAEQGRIEKGWHYHWHYQHSGYFADQVAAYLQGFSRVKVCLLEDLVRDPQTYIRGIFRFLEVDQTFEPDMSTHYNLGGVPRSRLLYRIVVGGNQTRPRSLQLAGRLFGEERLLRWRESLRPKVLVREEMRAETRNRLIRACRPDILSLQDLLDRDLSGWLAAEN